MGQPGLFTMEGSSFAVTSASCRLHGELLTVTADGPDFRFHLPCIPFGTASSPSELVGREWKPTSADLNASDTLNEGGYVVLRDIEYVPHTLSVRCIRVDSAGGRATFEFAMSGCFTDDDSFHELTGFANFIVDSPPCPECGEPLRSAKAQQCFACGAVWR
jgi:hypothetical protein